jgi:hypothetical protein
MIEELLSKKKNRLALAAAQGASVAAWARANGVPLETAYAWASEPEVRATVESCRRRTLDRAVGRMARRAIWAADEIAKLSRKTNSPWLKLAALRAMLSDLLRVTDFAVLEARIANLEAQSDTRTESTGYTG